MHDGKSDPGGPREQASVTGFELLAGAALPIAAELRFDITRGDADAAAEALPPGTAEQLLEQEERLLAWLEESQEHRLAFVTDPVGSLERAGLELDSEVLDSLRDLHTRGAGGVVPPGVAIRSVGVGLARDRPCQGEAGQTAQGD